jgi:hypothetical protein
VAVAVLHIGRLVVGHTNDIQFVVLACIRNLITYACLNHTPACRYHHRQRHDYR